MSQDESVHGSFESPHSTPKKKLLSSSRSGTFTLSERKDSKSDESDEFAVFLAKRPGSAKFISALLDPNFVNPDAELIRLQNEFQRQGAVRFLLNAQLALLKFFYYALICKEVCQDEGESKDFKGVWGCRAVKFGGEEFDVFESFKAYLNEPGSKDETAIFEHVKKWFVLHQEKVFFELEGQFKSACRIEESKNEEVVKQNAELLLSFKDNLNGYYNNIFFGSSFTQADYTHKREVIRRSLEENDEKSRGSTDAQMRIEDSRDQVRQFQSEDAQSTPVRKSGGNLAPLLGATPSPLKQFQAKTLADYAIVDAGCPHNLAAIVSQYYSNKRVGKKRAESEAKDERKRSSSDSHSLSVSASAEAVASLSSPPSSPFKVRWISCLGSTELQSSSNPSLSHLIGKGNQIDAISLLVRGVHDMQKKMLQKFARYFSIKNHFKPMTNYIAGKTDTGVFTWGLDQFEDNTSKLQTMFFNMAAASNAAESVGSYNQAVDEGELNLGKRYAPFTHMFTCCFPMLKQCWLFKSKRQLILDDLEVSVDSNQSYHHQLVAIDGDDRRSLLRKISRNSGCDFSELVVGPIRAQSKEPINPLTLAVRAAVKSGDSTKLNCYIGSLRQGEFERLLCNEDYEDNDAPMKWLTDYYDTYERFSTEVWNRFQHIEKIFDGPINYLQFKLNESPSCPELRAKLGSLLRARRECCRKVFTCDNQQDFIEQINGIISNVLGHYKSLNKKRTCFGLSTPKSWSLLNKAKTDFKENSEDAIYHLSRGVMPQNGG